MIPLAKELQEMNNNVIIGGSNDHLSLFRNELPGLSFIHFPGFKPGYSRFLPQYIPLLIKTPLLLHHIIHEHYLLKRIIRENNINIVISDNRFGLWNRKIKTVYVTHMPLIPFPRLLRSVEFIGILLHRVIIKRYSLCFIPDLPGKSNISGRLSHGIKLPVNVRYIGILSRFIPSKPSFGEHSKESQYYTIILSGPEPQKGILKRKLIDALKDSDTMTVILEGKPWDSSEIVRSGNITTYNHLSSSEMRKVLIESESIIARSGYSTIMDLISLNCSALLVPTPGQTEQEYLAEYLAQKGWFSFLKQQEIKKGIHPPSKNFNSSGKIIEQSRILMTKALKELLEKPNI